MNNDTTKAVVKAGKSDLATTPDTAPLTPEQEKRFEALETQIEENYLSGFKLAAALAEIRDKRLYRANYKTFEKYCKERWEYSRSYCERLADMDGVLKDLKDFEKTPSFPKNELQARVFVPLDTDQRIKLIESVEKDTEADNTTASLFIKYRNQLFPSQSVTKPKPVKSKVTVTDVESSTAPTPADMKKLVAAAEVILKRLGASKEPDEKELAGYLRDFIKLAQPSTGAGKEDKK